MRPLKYLFTFFLVLLLAWSCAEKNKLDIDISKIKIAVNISRFDSIFYNASPKTLSQVKEEFNYLFPTDVKDSVWLAKINNPDARFLYREVQKVFTDFKTQKLELIQVFKHISYYFPKFKTPKVVTLISDVDYNNKVIYTGRLLLISLDMYLGKNHRVYQNIPKYVRNSFTRETLKIDVAREIAFKSVPKNRLRTFISRCIQEGKILYTTKAFVPNVKDSLLFNYTPIKMEWALQNQEFVWRYFVENKLLFSTDKNIVRRFLEPAPFSKFYLVNDNYSPGRIGAFIGYKIVTSYMKHNNKSLVEMLQIPNDKLFKQSKYKPKN